MRSPATKIGHMSLKPAVYVSKKIPNVRYYELAARLVSCHLSHQRNREILRSIRIQIDP
jgi:hypothetical protein